MAANMKEIFNQKLKDYLAIKKDTTDYFTNNRYNHLVNEIKKAKLLQAEKMPLTPKQYIRLKTYDVDTINGKEKLVKVIAESSIKDVRYICKIEELYDIVKGVHLLTGHKGSKAIEMLVNQTYCNVTKAAIRLFLSMCPRCKTMLKTTSSQSTEKTEGKATPQPQGSNPANTKENNSPKEPNRNAKEPNIEKQEEPVMKKIRTAADHDPMLQNALSCIKTLLTSSNERDEHSVFGEHVAHRIRNSNRDNVEITVAQHRIENIIYNLVTGVYNDAQGASFETAIVPKTELEF